jgi:hypothetical protein
MNGTRRTLLGGLVAAPALAAASVRPSATPPHRGAGALTVLPVAGNSCHDDDDPDAELLTLCDAFTANRTACAAIHEKWGDVATRDTPDNILEVRSDLTEELWELRSAIGHTPATTRAGLMAKARMVLDDLADGGEAPEYDPESVAPWSLARDLLRLHGGAA